MSSRGSGRPGKQRVLEPERILDVALGLVDEGGAESLSIRRIARALGVAPNALYTYFPNRDALRAALVEHVLSELDGRVLGSDWRRGVRALAGDLRRALARHPGVVPLFVAGPMFGPRALALGEKILSTLVGAGFAPDAAARALYTVLVYTIGFAAMDAAELRPGLTSEAMDERVAKRRVGFEQVPADSYPLTRATAATAAHYVTDGQFRHGLDAIIRGLGPPAAPSRRRGG